jgi:hypothetical protein
VLGYRDGVEKAQNLVAAQHDQKPLRLAAGRDDLLDAPVPLERDLAEEAEGGDRNHERARRQMALLDAVELIGANVGGPQQLGRLAEVAGEPRDVLNVSALSIRRQVADPHILDHAAAKRGHGQLPCGMMRARAQPIVPQPERSEEPHECQQVATAGRHGPECYADRTSGPRRPRRPAPDTPYATLTGGFARDHTIATGWLSAQNFYYLIKCRRPAQIDDQAYEARSRCGARQSWPGSWWPREFRTSRSRSTPSSAAVSTARRSRTARYTSSRDGHGKRARPCRCGGRGIGISARRFKPPAEYGCPRQPCGAGTGRRSGWREAGRSR